MLSKNNLSITGGGYLANKGLLVSNQTMTLHTNSDITNDFLIKAENFNTTIESGDFNQNNRMVIDKHLSLNLNTSNTIRFNKNSHTEVGSFSFASLDNEKLIKEVSCTGCNFEAHDIQATNILKAGAINIVAAKYVKEKYYISRKQMYCTVRGGSAPGSDDWVSLPHSYIPWNQHAQGCHHEYGARKGILTCESSSHSVEGVSIFTVNGKIDIETLNIKIYLSSFQIANTLNFLSSNANVNIISEKLELRGRLDVREEQWIKNYVSRCFNNAHIHPITQKSDIGNTRVSTQVVSTFKSSFHAKSAVGNIKNLIAQGFTTGDNIPSIASENKDATAITDNLLALATYNKPELSNINNKIVPVSRNHGDIQFTTVTLDGKTITTFMTKEHIEQNGIDIALFINPNALNTQWTVTPFPANRITDILLGINTDYQLHYLIQLNPLMAEFHRSAISPEAFLQSLAFKAQGLIPVIGDGHYLAQLIDSAEF